jgi:hypothetical protein
MLGDQSRPIVKSLNELKDVIRQRIVELSIVDSEQAEVSIRR